ncbi:hypothetical protein C0Q70_05167 [Pomacea canaliculata]|uniref:Fucosyltransferase n=1 Tax=Pomacea canaliculata TaxID=400727 RepID=A0A2T7PKE4_POMCA|nr:alpha-(1,3)-fucosyltransferase C-like [Pomacea canaliculata]XP_025085786.1 alpha-(1,3)-fucosyltransferase C-like [Pomacea canaliculata]XP_025085787.1 alpha-(1,3)-fucosyltransferase C-like [Pomacea canaliculata]XP_025085788.1 alpha-(1,3)-fucosyltransferase C-like [Pomacea canaliculata]PVD33905.1 hypothetical protein C0Q70_05167 [Pomacea canaliculata]
MPRLTRSCRQILHIAIVVTCIFLTGSVLYNHTSLFRSRSDQHWTSLSKLSPVDTYKDVIQTYWRNNSKVVLLQKEGDAYLPQKKDEEKNNHDPLRRGVTYWERESRDASAKIGNQTSDVKVILMRDFPYYYEIKPGSQVFQGCPGVRSCTVATDSNVPADLVILFSINSNSRNYMNPPPRPANQMWAYFAVEAPPHSYSSVLGSPAWQLYFNWTMTYRLDSDIRFGYGIVVTKSSDSGSSDHKTYDESALMKKIRGKSKMAAIFVSNCNDNAQRLSFLKLLKKAVPGVDVYGTCGSLKCDKGSNSCHEMLERDYFFYLAFENSHCTDYVTEKAFLTLKYDVVPVVRGGANYSSLVPPMSVIDTSAFQSILDLGRYLQYLMDNPTEYLRYLRWKKDYVIVEPQPLPWCELCSKVHEAYKQRPQAYVNVNSWWVDGTCRQANDLHLYGQF